MPVLGLVVIIATAVLILISLVVRVTGLEYLRGVQEVGSYAASLALVFILSWLVYVLAEPPCAPVVRIPCGRHLDRLLDRKVAFRDPHHSHERARNLRNPFGRVRVLLWIYLICSIFLYGAHFSARWADRFNPRTNGP